MLQNKVELINNYLIEFLINFDDIIFRLYFTDYFLGLIATFIFAAIIVVLIILLNKVNFDKLEKKIFFLNIWKFDKFEKKTLIIFLFALIFFLLDRVTKFSLFFIFGEMFLIITKLYLIYICYKKFLHK